MHVFLACTYNAKINSSWVGGQVVICSKENGKLGLCVVIGKFKALFAAMFNINIWLNNKLRSYVHLSKSG